MQVRGEYLERLYYKYQEVEDYDAMAEELNQRYADEASGARFAIVAVLRHEAGKRDSRAMDAWNQGRADGLREAANVLDAL